MSSSVIVDLRYSLRHIRLAPLFTITVVLTLGLGIGATTAIFSLIYTVMLKSLPVPDPGSLYRIGTGKTCCYSNDLQGEWASFPMTFISVCAALLRSSSRSLRSRQSRTFLACVTAAMEGRPRRCWANT